MSNVAEDLSDIYKKRGMNVYNSVESSLDMEQLQQDYLQCNKDMVRILYSPIWQVQLKKKKKLP